MAFFLISRVVSNSIDGAFNKSGAIRAVALVISKTFDRVWDAHLLHKLNLSIWPYFFFSQLKTAWSGSWWEVSQEYLGNAKVPQRSILDLTLFLLCIYDPPDDVICDITVYTDDATLYSKCDQASDLWQQLELASKFEFDLWDTVDRAKKWFYDFSAAKTQVVLLDRSKNNDSIDVKMDGYVLEKKSSFNMLGVDCLF